jgi:MFS family permease
MLSGDERREKMKAVIRAGSGNFLELYDFLVYVYFATYIAKAFFPTKSEFMSLMLALGTYGVASIARPFGAIILGSYMDRKGRRKGLILTLTLMAVGTVSLAITPTYMAIGLLAPLLVTLGRVIQGFSLGVEAGGVNVYLAEIATPKNRGFYCAWQAASQALGVMAATGLGAVLTASLAASDMEAWGWRVPLIVGCMIVPVLFWLRRSLKETEYFQHSAHARSTLEILKILAAHWQIVAIGVLLTILNTSMFYFVNGYTATFGSQALHLPPVSNFIVAFLVATASFVMLPLGGALSDRIGRWPMVIGVPILVLATSYLALSWLVAAPSFFRFLLVEFWLAVLYAMYAGALVPLLTEIMPAKVRSSGYAIVLSLANGLFGTFTPAIVLGLTAMLQDRAAPALWLSAGAVVSILTALCALRFAPKLSVQAAE